MSSARWARDSVLDVGCGFADLYDHLRGRGWEGRYRGLDIVPGLLDVARRRHPSLDLQEADIATYDPARASASTSSSPPGCSTRALHGEDNGPTSAAACGGCSSCATERSASTS